MILALVRKEIRQNFILMVVGLCAVSIAFCEVLLSQGIPNLILGSTWRRAEPMPLLSEAMLLVASMYGLLGLGLGLIPAAWETEKETWAVLLRLPISRGKMLIGRTLGEAAVYFLAGAPPLVFAVVWAAIPGHYPGPFRIGMAAPALVAFLFGLVVYCASLLVGIRLKKELTASASVLPFLFAAVVFGGGAGLLVLVADGFLTAVLVEIGAMITFYWAAYSSFAKREF